MAAQMQIDQARPGSPSLGTPGLARNDLWLNRVITLSVTSGSAPYQWFMRSQPRGSTAAISGATTATATFTPDLGGTYRIELSVNGSTQVRVLRVRYDSGGRLLFEGMTLPAVGELDGEANYAGNARAWDDSWNDVFAYVAAKLAKHVPTLAALRLEQNAEGVQRPVVLEANAAQGDGGGGLFFWNATNNNTTRPDNNGRPVVVPTGLEAATGCWERIVNENSSFRLRTVTVANLAGGGSLGSAATTVDVASTIDLAQTTAGQSVTIANPTDATAGKIVIVNNTGSTAVTLLGDSIPAGKGILLQWTGAAWGRVGGTPALGITDIVAGNGLTGGGSSGSVPLHVAASDTTISIATDGIAVGQIADANVAVGAAVAGIKIVPDFGAQDVTTTGVLGVGASTAKVRIRPLVGTPTSPAIYMGGVTESATNYAIRADGPGLTDVTFNALDVDGGVHFNIGGVGCATFRRTLNHVGLYFSSDVAYTLGQNARSSDLAVLDFSIIAQAPFASAITFKDSANLVLGTDVAGSGGATGTILFKPGLVTAVTINGNGTMRWHQYGAGIPITNASGVVSQVLNSSGSAGKFLSWGAGVAAVWALVDMATVSGTLPVANGGTGAAALAAGVIHSNGTVLSSSPVVNADVSAGIAGSKIVPTFGTQDLSATGAHVLASGATGSIAETVKGFAGQTADLTRWTTSTGTPLSAITKDGFLGLAVGAVGTPALFFQGDPDTGIFWVGANDFALAANGVATFRVNANGVGFNGATPTIPVVSGVGSNLGPTGALFSIVNALFDLGIVGNGGVTPGPVLQSFAVTLVGAAGQSAAIAANVSASSVIVCTLKTPGGTAGAGTVGFAARSAERVNGTPGSFKVSAVDKDGNVVSGSAAIIDVLVYG